MLKEVEWSENRSYRSRSDNEPIAFYLEGLCNSTSFDLLLGYFSSAAISVLSLGFATFLYSGGTMRMVINNVLSQNDTDAIKAANEGNYFKNALDISDIKQLKRSLDEYGIHFFECLAWLIANKRIELKIVSPKDGVGYYISGVFSDASDSVGFYSYCNFISLVELNEKKTKVDAFMSWDGKRSNIMINSQNEEFENLFSGNAEFTEYMELSDVFESIISEFGGKTLEQLYNEEKTFNILSYQE